MLRSPKYHLSYTYVIIALTLVYATERTLLFVIRYLKYCLYYIYSKCGTYQYYCTCTLKAYAP
jgi:hypothetical protein